MVVYVDRAERSQLLPRQPIPPRRARSVRLVGTLRLPLAGPYRPRVRLYRFPDGRLVWHVRLWEFDHAVPHLVPTGVLREFARLNRLAAFAAELEMVLAQARASGGP